ncbi:MAG: type IVB secretion system protein DotA [Legionellaceae bacterium]|nr:type IVB secretion system protein DotA [Legionellaceae bacterium]
MKNRWFFLFLFLCPLMAIADNSMSFTPPATDYSVIFLGNIFGVVDGVLHGTGSQIMGTMFGVFNAAVLALGGIVVMYTLIVGTMNTAHEGQMLGQKWSSIWIPVRSTIGLAFLIPKASGYCLMQIFIMWVVVQGVGAADKIWDATLDYLNRGGSIVKAQISANSTTPSSSSSNKALVNLSKGAGLILAGQVCMRGLQVLLENQRTALLENAEHGSGSCAPNNLNKETNPNVNPDMVYFCNNPVPDFISTVNVIDVNNKGSQSECAGPDSAVKQLAPPPTSVMMPHFQDNTYSKLNGVCGTLKWNEFDPQLAGASTLSCSDRDTTKQSRVVAIQQIYSDLTPVAMTMVNNDPQINKQTSNSTATKYSNIALNQFGLPYLSSGSRTCDIPSSDCTNWGPDRSAANQSLILTGYELQNALLDYDGIMLPALKLVSDLGNAKSVNKLRSFIKDSKAEGWIMAGAYFFDLVYLNGMVTSKSNIIDEDSGLDTTDFDVALFSVDPFKDCSTSVLCLFFDGIDTSVKQLASLFDGSGVLTDTVPLLVDTTAKAVTTTGSSTVYGYITNGAMVHLPGQPGLVMPSFRMNFNIQVGGTKLNIPKKKFHGFFAPLESFFYNDIFRGLSNVFIGFIVSTFDAMLQSFLYFPLTDLMTVFNSGVQLLQTTMVHPIIALAFMGGTFINASVDIWLNLIAFAVVFGILTQGLALVAILLVLPFLSSWLGIMTSIGFVDAYYVPFVPYMIFTFGTIAWLMAVIESMVAGPIVALGVTHPEGHDALGKAEQALMILVNVFLRPAMMIIGYVAAIALSYVTVFILNSGFFHILKFLTPSPETNSSLGTPYTNWAAIYASFFCLVTYTTMYVTVVQKTFTLIYALPDKILRWIGSQGESYGQDTAQWSEDVKGQAKDTGEATGKSSMKIGGSVMGMAESVAVGANKGASGGSVSAT